MLLILAAFRTMASASATFPWESSHRGDSGITLVQYSKEKQVFSMAEIDAKMSSETNICISSVCKVKRLTKTVKSM